MTDPLTIQVDYDNTEFTPGDTISGNLSWTAPPGTEAIAMRLFWFTSGRGTQDIEIINETTWPISHTTASQGSEKFSFILPNKPYSFSGKIISLTWALEAVILPDETSLRHEFTLTPNGKEIVLDAIENTVTSSKKSKWFKTNR